MQTDFPIKKTVLLLVVVLISTGLVATAADARHAHSSAYNPHSGIIAAGYYEGHCFGGTPPLCLRPRPYLGLLSVFNASGRLVTSVSGDIDGNFTAGLRPGTYTVVPTDPELADFAQTVTVGFKQFVSVTIALPWNADP